MRSSTQKSREDGIRTEAPTHSVAGCRGLPGSLLLRFPLGTRADTSATVTWTQLAKPPSYHPRPRLLASFLAVSRAVCSNPARLRWPASPPSGPPPTPRPAPRHSGPCGPAARVPTSWKGPVTPLQHPAQIWVLCLPPSGAARARRCRVLCVQRISPAPCDLRATCKVTLWHGGNSRSRPLSPGHQQPGLGRAALGSRNGGFLRLVSRPSH